VKTATGTSILRAFERASQRMKDQQLTATEESAGFAVKGKPGHQTGYQVFVKCCRYSEELLRKEPDTGGLLVERV
jgi:hypothetical protein